ncbi:MAG TPA: MFS transporter [Chloroflexaceae bacterium]|mgnify:CR=1 FL=1|nr:MFS transporter [Chloroflexaceae bacterium]
MDTKLAGAEGAQAARGGTFAALRHRDYRLLWVAILFMSAGQWIQQVTLGWLVYDMTASAVVLGLLNGLRSLPFLVAGPLAGVLIDRVDRRRLLIETQAVLCVATLGTGVLVATGAAAVWHLFVFTLVSGIAWSINQPLRQALIPAVVPRDDLMNAVALSSAGFNIMKILGPALAGGIIVWFGAAGNFYLQAGTYAGVLLMGLLMVVPVAPAPGGRGSALGDLREGLAYVRRSPLVLALLLVSLLMNLFALPYLALMPVFQKDVLGVGPEGLGLMLAAPGVGALASTLALASLTNRIRRKGALLLAGMTGLGLALVAFAQARSFPLAMLALVAVGACQILCLSVNLTMLQMIVPDELRGRVISLAMLDRGLAPLGALLAGVMAQFAGAVATVTVFGALTAALTLLVAWRVPRLHSAEIA